MSTKRNLARNNPRLEVDLKNIFGRSVPRSEDLKQAIGQVILDKIVKRTKSGKDIKGKAFKPYSKQYIKSDDFKSFGKSKSPVNLTLTGDMLGLMDIVKIEGNKLIIGWTDSEEGAKAHGHISGGGNLPKRDFFDLRPGEIKSIKSEFKSAIDEIASETKPSESFIANIIKELENGED